MVRSLKLIGDIFASRVGVNLGFYVKAEGLSSCRGYGCKGVRKRAHLFEIKRKSLKVDTYDDHIQYVLPQIGDRAGGLILISWWGRMRERGKETLQK